MENKMRQQKNQHHQQINYSELVCVIPGRGMQTLFRGKTYAQALAFRSNNALRTFHGRKVSIAERRSESSEPTGWLYQEQLKHEGDTAW
tara:strand:- start:9149 stop:9415 length:267 start_codon:yes stop_codon:yes gene_type:complete